MRGTLAHSLRIQAKRGAGGSPIQVARRLCRALVFLLLGTALAMETLAQNDSGADLRYRLRTGVELVLVPVTVKDAQGHLVTDLGRDDFQLFEEGQEQPIRYFSVDPFPLSVVILVDVGLSPPTQAAVRTMLPVLPSVFGPADEFAFYVFDTYPRQVLDFTDDAERLREALREVGKGSGAAAVGVTGGPLTAGPRINTVPVGPGVPSTLPRSSASVKSIHDALFAAGLALRDQEPGRRRVIFIISDGSNSRLNTHSLEETRDLLLTEDVSVYALGAGEARFALGQTPLAEYARATGGDYYEGIKEETLARAWARIAEQARNQYTLVYAAPPAGGSREYRRIEVRVRRPGVTLLSRKGYFASAPLR
ncbi:MAG: VWA domain-containing protein [Acidobacteria bacterium]|nr:VWA domain-containing protein [Acidobacteriota bacterium]